MRKLLCLLIVVAMCVGMMLGCTPSDAPKADEDADQMPGAAEQVPDETIAPQTVEPTEKPTAEPTTEPTEEPTAEPEDDRTEEILAFLAVLGLGADTMYENVDWFEQDMLVSVSDVDAARVDAIDQKLKDDGFMHPQDPEYIEETTMRHIQYSGEALFIDVTYIEKDEYLTVLFSPLQ